MYDKITGPCVWYADDLQHSSTWHFEWSKDELQEIDTALSKVDDVNNWQQLQNFALPQTTKKLQQIQKFLEEDAGLALLKGFPRHKYSVAEITAIFWALAQHVGHPISQSADDDKIFSVRDAGFPAGHPKSRGPNTKNKLSFHTDRCDVISFFCVEKAKEGGENLIVSSPAIHNEIHEKHPHLLPILYSTFYNKRHNVDAGNSKPFCELPIFSQHQGHFAANIMRVLIFRAHEMPETPELSDLQRQALEMLEEIAADPKMHIRFTQEPGDILFVNNFITFHSRTEFEDHEQDEKKRHLLRIWLAVPNSRPLSPLFAPNYGNTNAGAIRGGMKPHLYKQMLVICERKRLFHTSLGPGGTWTRTYDPFQNGWGWILGGALDLKLVDFEHSSLLGTIGISFAESVDRKNVVTSAVLGDLFDQEVRLTTLTVDLNFKYRLDNIWEKGSALRRFQPYVRGGAAMQVFISDSDGIIAGQVPQAEQLDDSNIPVGQGNMYAALTGGAGFDFMLTKMMFVGLDYGAYFLFIDKGYSSNLTFTVGTRF